MSPTRRRMVPAIPRLPVLAVKTVVFVLVFATYSHALTPSGDWFAGCFPDTDLLTKYQDVFVPDGEEVFNTTFTEVNAVNCGTRCTHVPSVKFALFSQTGLCLCAFGVYNSSAVVSDSNCEQKVCNFTEATGGCDGATYHWLVNMTSMLKSVTIVSSAVLTGSVPQNITVVTDPVDINVRFKFDFGDGISLNYVDGRNIGYVYKNSGFYKVTVTAATLNGMGTASASKVLQVKTAPFGVNISIPSILEVDQTKQFTVAIAEGNNMTIDGTTYIGNTLISTLLAGLAIEDAFIIAVGAQADVLIRAANITSSPNTDIYIMPQFKFPANGIISAFQAFISKAGYLRFQIYRPSCLTGTVYCYPMNGCNSTCSDSVDMMSNVTASTTAINGTTPKFTLISEISFLANTTGLRFFKLKSTNIEVQRGDVLGLKLTSSEGDVSHSTDASAMEYHFSPAAEVFPGMTIAVSHTPKTTTHMVAAYLSTTSTFKMTTTFAEIGVGAVRINAKHPTFPVYVKQKYVQVQERITGLKIDEPKAASVQAYELNKGIAMTTSTTKGSNITYHWIIEVGAENFTLNNTNGNMPFTPRTVGIYDLRTEAENLLSKENTTTQFKVQEKIAEMQVLGLVNGAVIAKANLPITFTVSVLNGTNVTLKATLEGIENSTMIANASGGMNHVFQFSPLTGITCKKTSVVINAKNDIPATSITKTVDIAILCPITGVELKGNPGFFITEGVSTLTTSIDSPVQVTVTIETGSFVVYSLQKDPSSPDTDVKNQSTQINPTAVTFTLQYSMPKEYTVKLNLTNPISSVIKTFVVKVIECPPEILEITGSPDSKNPTFVTRGMDYRVTGTTEEQNCSKAAVTYKIALFRVGDEQPIGGWKNVPKNELVYIIPKRSQPHGNYRVTFLQNATLAKGPQVIQKSAYVMIKETPLFASIDSGSKRVVPLMKRLHISDNTTSYYKVVLDGSASKDPDDESTKIEFQWFCRGNGTKATLDRRPQLCNHTEERPYLESDWKSKMTVDTKYFQVKAKYSFILKVKHLNRTSTYVQEIEFLEGEPPAVEIECVTNCNTKWNNQEKIILRGNCPNCVNLWNIIYYWEMRYENNTIIPGVTGTTNGQVTSTLWDKQNLVINAGQLKSNFGFKVTLKARYGETGTNTTITMERKTASLPHSGACEIYPKEGFVAETKYQIRCQNWKCEDVPMKYEFMTKKKSASVVQISTVSGDDYPIWYNGNEPWNPPNILPIGIPAENFTLQMVVRIYNSYGSFHQLKEINVTVKNIAITKDKNASSVIEGSKPKTNDSVSLSQWAASAASILNTEPGDLSGGSEEGSGQQTQDNKKQLEETRTKIIDSLSKADLKDISMSNLKQLGEALGSVVSKVDELNDDSESIGSGFLSKIAESFLSNNDPNAGAALLEQASAAIIGPLSDLMSATTSKSEALLIKVKDIDSENEASPTAVTPTISGFTTARPTKKQYQNKAAESKKNVLNYISVLDNVSERIFRNKVSGEVPTVTKTDSFNLVLVKKKMADLSGASVDAGDESYGVVLPDGMFNDMTFNGSSLFQNDTEVSLQGSSMKKILHTWDVDNAKDSASRIESLKMLTRDYKGYTVANLTSDITIKIENRPEKLNLTKISLTFPQEMKIRTEKIKSFDNPLLVEFGSPDNSSSNLTVLIQYGVPPTLANYDARLDITPNGIALAKNEGNVSVNGSLNATSPEDKPLVRSSHIRVIDGSTIILWDFANFTYGALGNGEVFFNLFYNGDMPEPIYIPNEYTFDILEIRRSRNYTIRTFSASCLYWNENASLWTGDGCKVDPYTTTFKRTVCKCNHLTSFGGFYVKPRPIPPLTADMFLKGYVLFVSVTVTLMFFIIGLVMARRADKKDILKVGVCPLPDNNPNHTYLYQITVWTGLRREAGTKSNVYFILSGDKGDTQIRHMKDPERTTFQQNSSDVFVFSTESTLGDLSHIRIWHDNTGGGWYLRKMVITDLQTDKTFQFLCNRWLAVDKDDGQIEFVAPVSGTDELKEFNYVFMAKTRSDLSDSHLWFSLYARPPRSPFTRCQRLACCMSLLMTSMMTSAMFYNTYPKPTPETANYAAGLTFTWKQVYVAIISAAITVPINVIIVTLFRSSKPKDIIEVQKRSLSKTGSKASLADNNSIKSVDSSATLNSPESPVFNQYGEQPLLLKEKEPGEAKKEKEKQKKKESYLFPYWCVYIGWALAFIGIVSSSIVVIMYGMVFGNSVSLEWLSSIILGFIQDIVVIQPIKIFVIALFFAAIIKNVQDERPQVEEQGKKLAEDEEWLHANADTSLGTSVDTTSLRPPAGLKLDAMRELRFKERKMYAIMREILLYTFFVLVTFSISYSLREEVGFWQTNGLERLFNLPTKETGQFASDQFTGVLSYNNFWSWSENVLIDQLFPEPWYKNGDYPQKTKEFPGKLVINDLNHKIVNGVRLRQVRVKKDSCRKAKQVRGVFSIDCAAPYGLAEEDQSHSINNWTNNVETRPPITRTNQPWLYQKWNELDGYPFMAELTSYFGGGYTQDLFPRWPNKANLEKLRKARWIDRHTRAVIIEFALFNPSTNHFSMVTITFEFAATGGCIHYYSIYTFKLYRYTTGYAFFTIVCEVLFLLMLLLYLYREGKEWYQLRGKYFRQFWNLVEVTINILSIVAIGFYFYRQKLASDLLRRLPAKKPQTFINFQFAAYIDQVFIYVVSLIVFFVSIKFVKLLRFNRRMSILAETLKDAWYPLGMFSIVMGIVLTSTFAFATIVFGRQMYGYRNMLVTAATQISLLLGKFNFYEYQDTNRVIGPIFFLLYIIMVNWILLNMFLSIINDSYEVVSSGLKEQSNDYEIVDFVMDQFKAWIGHGRTRKDEIKQNIRWQSATKKMNAMRAFSAASEKKGVHWGDEDVLSGLTRSVYWHENPSIFEKKDLDSSEISKTVDRFVECINLLYFDDTEVAEKMSKKVKQEISDYDFLKQQEKTNKE